MSDSNCYDDHGDKRTRIPHYHGPAPVPFEPGPGLRLVQARQRMQRAVLAICTQNVTGTYAGSEEATEAYAEMSAAARQLVLAQNAYDDHTEAKRAEMANPALRDAQGDRQ